MPKNKTKPYDVAEYLETEEEMAAYLQAALEDGDPALVIHALGNIARALAACLKLLVKRAFAARAFTKHFRPEAIRSCHGSQGGSIACILQPTPSQRTPNDAVAVQEAPDALSPVVFFARSS